MAGLGTLARRAARGAVRRSVALTCAWYLIDDWRAGRRIRRGDIATRSGARHKTLSLSDSLAYIDAIHGDYLSYAGRERLSGTIAEIGPGDNFGMAMRLLGDGAEAVHAIDRYASERDAAQQAEIYRALADAHGLAALFDGPAREGNLRGLTYHPGRPAETFFAQSGLRFDAILSRAVLEHLYDPIAALDDMAAALNPGGLLVHRIDLRDHGMFDGRHPLTFLTISDVVYGAMTRASGRPNRVQLPAWRDWLKRSGLTGSLRVTRLAGVPGEIAPTEWDAIDPAMTTAALATVRTIRPRLAAGPATLDDRDLAVAGCVLVAEKPGHGAASKAINCSTTAERS